MKNLHNAIKEYKEWIAKGINAKIVWHYHTQSYRVIFIWFPTMSGRYKRII